MRIFEIKRSVIPATAARLQQQNSTNKPFPEYLDPTPQHKSKKSFEENLEQHNTQETFNGDDPSGQSISVGVCVLDTIGNLVKQTTPTMGIHELNIRLKLKRQEGDLIKRLPPPTPRS